MKKTKELHEMLYDLRTAKGLKQIHIANLLGIRQQTYSTYEKGTSEVPSRFLVQLAQYYNVHTDYILGNTSAQSNTMELNLPFTPEYTVGEFLAICMSLDKKCKHELYDYAKYLSQKS